MQTVGADPEVFVINKDNHIVSAIGRIGGTKENPVPVGQGALQEDNVLAEFNIDPCHTAQEFSERCSYVHNQLDNILSKDGLSTVIKGSHHFTVDELFEDEKALTFGCNPDLNAYTGRENDTPAGSMTTLRTAGGHVHIGYDSPDPVASLTIVKACDILLGIPSVLLDDDIERRRLYGKSGACRVKAYGVEYRSLSNFWLRSDELKRWVFSSAVKASKYYNEILQKANDMGITSDMIRHAIDESDREAAQHIVETLSLEIPLELSGEAYVS